MTQADVDRASLIRYIEREGTFGERVWLPLLRLTHKLALKRRKE